MVIEIQLAIKSERSNFIKHSDKFNHFIYELQRCDFGPIMELCKIWMVNEPKAEFYEEEVKADRIYILLQPLRLQCNDVKTLFSYHNLYFKKYATIKINM